MSFLEGAKKDFKELKSNPDLNKKKEAVQKALGLLIENPRHAGLKTHLYKSIKGANGEKIFEAYAENDTPGAYRIFFHYEKGKKES